MNLFAADPMIAKPVGMNWDSEGRLWVVSSRLYPHIKPGQRSDDQVVVLEDTDRDGRADQSTVFAEDLLIPTGIMPGDGGAYVANSTEILFIKDTDGDLVGDERQIMLSGFGTEDTHHIIHAFRGGPDGMLYFNQSIYIHSHVETPYGVRRLMAGGIWHLRPETLELEVFARGFVNTWGHAFDRYGQSFATDGAYGEGINYVFPGSVFFTAYNAKRVIKGLNPGQPKHCGLEIIDSSHFPDDWQGTMITNDFRGHRVNRFVVTESGSGYVSRQAPDLIRTKHNAFRPIDAKIGPDGALYIADWYNPIIQHGEVDFRDPRRDHTHGRIWRVTYKGRPLANPPKVKGQSPEKMVTQLQSADGLTRHFAKRELRKADRTKALEALGQASTPTGEDALELLWAHQSLNDLNEPLLRKLLASEDHRLRAAAVRVLYHWHERVGDARSLLGHAIADDHPRVRLEAINALRQIGDRPSFALAMTALEKPIDKNIDFALWLTARDLEPIWLPALESGETDFSPSALQFILTASEKPEAIRFLHAGFQKAVEQGEDVSAMADLFATTGGPAALDLLYRHALNKEDDAMLGRLYKAVADRKVKPENLRPERLVKLIEKGLPHAIVLGGAWKVEAARALIEKRLTDRATSPEYAISALTHYGDAPAGKTLGTVAVDTDWKPGLRAAAVAGLVQIDPPTGLKAAVNWLETAESPEGSETVFRAYLVQKNGPEKLAKALEGKTIPAGVATAGVQQAGTSGGKTAGLIAALTRAGGLTPITEGLSGEEMAAFVRDVQDKGDAHRGEAVYRRANLLCQTCHAIGGGGGVIGPDMVSIGASAPVDYIVDSLLEPGKKIKEGYHTTVVTSKSGEVVTGGLVRDSDDELVLRLADGSEKAVAAKEVAKKEVIPVSLMPPGLTASLRKDEMLDLVRFLSELGKEGDFKTPANRYVRRWRVLPADDQVSHKIRRNGSQGMLGEGDKLPWQPAYSKVSGELPLTEIGMNKGFNNDLSFARFEIEVTAPGEIGFRFDNPQGLQVISGSAAVDATRESTAVFEQGQHAIILLIDRVVRSDGGIKVELFDVEGSSGRARAVTGL
ncbi:MAG: PVC-type heme-binding CxxCH protein [Verrucomicrobiota bacterium]